MGWRDRQKEIISSQEARVRRSIGSNMGGALKRSGPKGSLFWGNLLDFGRDPLGFLESCVESYGDFVPLRFFNRPVYLLNDPVDIEYVLAGNHRNFRKTL